MISGTGLWFTYQIQRHEAVEQEQRAFSRTRLETAACKEAHAAFTRAAFKAASTETINRARAQEKQACGE
jgi:hypothetical protein